VSQGQGFSHSIIRGKITK